MLWDDSLSLFQNDFRIVFPPIPVLSFWFLVHGPCRPAAGALVRFGWGSVDPGDNLFGVPSLFEGRSIWWGVFGSTFQEILVIHDPCTLRIPVCGGEVVVQDNDFDMDIPSILQTCQTSLVLGEVHDSVWVS